MIEYMLSTIDNPFDPFDRFEDWLRFDEEAGYYSLEYLARIVRTSYDTSEADQMLDIKQAIDEIVRMNLYDVHMKVSKTTDVVENALRIASQL